MTETQKLRLELDELAVDSFRIAAADEARGTVRGNDDITAGPSCRNTCTTCEFTNGCSGSIDC